MLAEEICITKYI